MVVLSFDLEGYLTTLILITMQTHDRDEANWTVFSGMFRYFPVWDYILGCNSDVLSHTVRLKPSDWNIQLCCWHSCILLMLLTSTKYKCPKMLSNLFYFNKFHINSVFVISWIKQWNISTISWSGPPVPLWNVLDLHQVTLPLVSLLVGLKHWN